MIVHGRIYLNAWRDVLLFEYVDDEEEGDVCLWLASKRVNKTLGRVRRMYRSRKRKEELFLLPF